VVFLEEEGEGESRQDERTGEDHGAGRYVVDDVHAGEGVVDDPVGLRGETGDVIRLHLLALLLEEMEENEEDEDDHENGHERRLMNVIHACGS
jgi:hypothetical protein